MDCSLCNCSSDEFRDAENLSGGIGRFLLRRGGRRGQFLKSADVNSEEVVGGAHFGEECLVLSDGANLCLRFAREKHLLHGTRDVYTERVRVRLQRNRSEEIACGQRVNYK